MSLRAVTVVWLAAVACVAPKRAVDVAAPPPDPQRGSSTTPELAPANPTELEFELARSKPDAVQHRARLRVWSLDDACDERTLVVPNDACDFRAEVAAFDLDPRRGDFGPVGDRWIARLETDLLRASAASQRLQLRVSGGPSTRVYLGDELILRGPLAETTVDLVDPRTRLTVEHGVFGANQALKLEQRVDGEPTFVVLANERLSLLPPEVDFAARDPAGRMAVALERGEGEEKTSTSIEREPPHGMHPAFELTPITSAPIATSITAAARFGPLDWLFVVDTALVRGPVAAQLNTRRVASGLESPRDTAIIDGRTFVLQSFELTELIDIDSDGVADEYRALWNVPKSTTDVDLQARALCPWRGSLFVAMSASARNDERSAPGATNGGAIVRVDPRSGEASMFATLARSPQGLSSTPEHLVVTEHLAIDGRSPAPVLALFDFDGRRAGEVRLPRFELASGAMPTLGQPGWWSQGPFANQGVIFDARQASLLRVAIDRHRNSVQGAVFRFERHDPSLASGPSDARQRIVASNDGTAFLFDTSTTHESSTTVRKLVPRDSIVFEWVSLRSITGGFELEFSAPLKSDVGADSGEYVIDSDPFDASQINSAPKVREATVSADRTRVVLAVDGLQSGTLVHVVLPASIVDADGRPPWSTEAWYTWAESWQRTPRAESEASEVASDSTHATSIEAAAWTELSVEALLAAEPPASTLDGWTVAGGEWCAERGARTLVTRGDWAEFELEFEWRVPRGGAGSIGAEPHPFALVDEEHHIDGRNPLRVSGAAFDSRVPQRISSKPTGEWNSARIVVRGNSVEHWSHEKRVLEFERARVRTPLQLIPRGSGICFRSVRWRALEP